MLSDNNASKIIKKLLVETARLCFEGRLEEGIDRLVIDTIPKKSNANRCCVHKDRAVIKYRLMAILGHSAEEEEDELKRLSEYAGQTLQREEISEPVLTVIDEACSACPAGRHFVTNVCRGCVARPCMVNCPKDAIQIHNGRAEIDEDKCVNCGICLKVCPYNAIVEIPVPCENACPVGAISKDESGKEQIDYSKCIFCGRCMTACPFGAIMERSQIIDVARKLAEGRKVAALTAPSAAGQFPCEFSQLKGAILKAGFSEVLEVAEGADITAKKEAGEFEEKISEGQKFMTSSCCPVYKEAAKKHIPELCEFISDTPTPMEFAGRKAKEKYPGCTAVFIGPCIAKRQEALEGRSIDHVLTCEELGAILVAKDIFVRETEPAETPGQASIEARKFGASGGVTEAVKANLSGNIQIKPELIDGLDNKNIKKLADICTGKTNFNFVEVMNCKGGCVGGPGNLSTPARAAKRIEKTFEP
ncbi:monomeric [FeFe] hydrogenase [Sedimentisphaera salicampi]|uniref:Iron hydrogenase 1 n=1 Tax=Sedimentisphaera salicampi TaxID=1941349 RepID=A0A1W6LL45_9BACT|nr:monomeric [FeFe] hydrogenase [Sedimentisphaera salicampi]ARN56462.1 Iron hydrogenase 1 [Sedimentisphaera salicampi]